MTKLTIKVDAVADAYVQMKEQIVDITTKVTTAMRTMTFWTRSRPRGVAQPGSAPEWGSGGRRFKSSHPDS